MFNVSKAEMGYLNLLKSYIKYGYDMECKEDSDFLNSLLKKSDELFCILEDNPYQYPGKEASLLDNIDYVKKFFSILYNNNYNKIINKVIEATDFYRIDNIKGNVSHSYKNYEVGSLDLGYISLSIFDDIEMAASWVHEIGHSINTWPANFYYNEVLPLTFERIFNVLNNKEGNILMTSDNIVSSSYASERYDNIKFTKLRNNVCLAQQMLSKQYLIGFVYALRLCEVYFEDPKRFSQILMKNRANIHMPETLFKYYGIKFESDKSEKLLLKQWDKVTKKALDI